jgi:hypothetical protein
MKRLIPGILLVLSVGCASDVSAPAGLTPRGPSLDIAPLSATTIVVSPVTPNGWAFFDDNGNGNGGGAFAIGPAVAPLGAGSAGLNLTASNAGWALGAAILGGTRFADLTTVAYSTYRQSVDAGNNLAIALQFNFDADVTDAANAWQGRLVFEPYQTFSGGVTQGTWQTWDALAGKWWRSSGALCAQATPCTMAQVLANWPNAGVHPVFSGVVLKAGSGWTTFAGNTDKLTIGVSGNDVTYDFEPFVVAATKEQCMDGGWSGVKRADGSSFKNQGDCIQYVNTGK